MFCRWALLTLICQSLPTPPDVGGLEAELNDPVDKKIYKIDILCMIDPFAHIEHAVQGGGWKHRGPGLENRKGFVDQLADVPGFFILDDPGQGAIDIPQGFLVDN